MLIEGVMLREAQVPGLLAAQPDGIVAEVTHNPRNPDVLGLRNRSNAPWAVTFPDGARRAAQPGETVRLASNAEIRFGATVARVM